MEGMQEIAVELEKDGDIAEGQEDDEVEDEEIAGEKLVLSRHADAPPSEIPESRRNRLAATFLR